MVARMVNGKQHWEMTPAELETELDGVERRITKIVLSLFVFQVKYVSTKPDQSRRGSDAASAEASTTLMTTAADVFMRGTVPELG